MNYPTTVVALQIADSPEYKKQAMENWCAQNNIDPTPRPGFIIIAGEMPCGVKYAFATISDIPDLNLACSCGDPAHWIVKYANSNA